MKNLGIEEIYQEDERTLCIHWNTGVKKHYDVVTLRRKCPCASCVDENTGKRKLAPTSVKEETRPVKINSVGTYALNIIFNDGHKTGLYTYESLFNKTFIKDPSLNPS